MNNKKRLTLESLPNERNWNSKVRFSYRMLENNN